MADKKKSSKNLEAIKLDLLERKNQLEYDLAALNAEGATDQVLDAGDQAQSVSSETIRRSLQDTEVEEYNRLLKALEMIDEGVYGTCVDCDQAISEKRLKLFPNATRCIVCQEQFEETGGR